MCMDVGVCLCMCVGCVCAGLAASAESLVFVQDEVEEGEELELGAGEGEGTDGSAPWYLRVQELAHDSLIAATRAQLAKDAKDARANSNSKDRTPCCVVYAEMGLFEMAGCLTGWLT